MPLFIYTLKKLHNTVSHRFTLLHTTQPRPPGEAEKPLFNAAHLKVLQRNLTV